MVLAGRRYSWRGVEAETIVERVRRGFALFGWQAPELRSEEVDRALDLPYAETELLRTAPPSGHFSVADVLVAAASKDQSVGEVVRRIAQLSTLGVSGPSEEELYLGVRWGDVIDD